MSVQRHKIIQSWVVTADQMRQIEERGFAAGMPVAALMEKVAGLLTQRIQELYPGRPALSVGVLAGPGHNGGDALVVARELHLKSYTVVVYQPFATLKELTELHATYDRSLGIPFVEQVEALRECDVLVDGLFGFGLERPLTENLRAASATINQWNIPVVSIDLPSGLHTDTGQVLGAAIRATHTLCLGLWKQGLLQESALEWVGQAELIDFGLPLLDIKAVLGSSPTLQRITSEEAIAHLPLTRSPTAHKYTMGHGLLVCGSHRYAGAAILCGLGARATGVGMLSVAVPESIKLLLSQALPEALIIGCPETEAGAIAHFPEDLDLDTYSAIACGPGLTLEALPIVQTVMHSQHPLVLDADGLNALAQLGTVETLRQRTAPTILTPHFGEFKRLFPALSESMDCRFRGVREAAHQSGAIVLLKGARTAIADTQTVWINPESTPALARGGSGDVLTGLIGGLLAQAAKSSTDPIEVVKSAVWWHSQAGIRAVQDRTLLGVDAHSLTQHLIPALAKWVE